MATGTTSYYDVGLTISDGDQNIFFTEEFKDSRGLNPALSTILKNNKDSILNTFPANQWIYQWIISSELDGTLQSFFTAFGVTGNENLMNALLNDYTISELGPGTYVLSFEGY